MTIDDKIRDEKLEYGSNIEAAKITALSSGKIDKYEYLKGEETVPSNQRQTIKQAQSVNFLLGKLLKNKEKRLKIKE